jgi:O-antigen/teichoic acid export membrane protein
MNLKQNSVRGLAWSAAQSSGGQVTTLIVFALLARLLDPSAFGLIALANIFVAFAKVFADQGFAMAIIQRRDLQPAHLNTAFWTNVAVGLLLMCVTIASAGWIALLFKTPELAAIIRWLSIVFLVSSLSAVQQALLVREFKFKYLAIRSLTATVVGGIVGVSMAFLGYGVWSLVGQQLAHSLVQIFLLWRVSQWRPAIEFSNRHLKDLVSYGANIVGINLAEFVNRNADNFLIGFYLGPIALGYYALAYKLFSTLLRLFVSITGRVVFSSFSAIQASKERMRKAFYSATQMTSLITFPMFSGLAVIAPYLIVLVFGQQWQASVPVIQLLALVGILETVYLYNANVMLAMGKPSWKLKLNLINALINLVAFAIAVRWGIVAVAAAYVIRAYLLSPIALILVRKLIDIQIRVYLQNLGTALIASIAMVTAIFVENLYVASFDSLLMNVSLSIGLGIIVYTATAYALAPSLIKQICDLFRSKPNSHEPEPPT